MKKNLILKALCVILVLTTVFPVSPSPVSAVAEANTVPTDAVVQSLNDQLSELDRKRGEIDAEIRSIVEERGSLWEEINAYERLINIDTEKKQAAQKLADYYTKQIEETSQRIEETTARLEAQENAYYGRMVDAYMEQDADFIELVLGAADLVDFLTKVDYVSSIIENDKRIMTQLEKDRATLAEAEAQYEKAQAEQIKNVNEYEASIKELAKLQNSVIEAYERLQQDEEQQRIYANNVRESTEELNATLEKRLADLAAEQERQRIAAAEQRKKEAEEAAAREAAAKAAAEKAAAEKAAAEKAAAEKAAAEKAAAEKAAAEEAAAQAAAEEANAAEEAAWQPANPEPVQPELPPDEWFVTEQDPNVGGWQPAEPEPQTPPEIPAEPEQTPSEEHNPEYITEWTETVQPGGEGTYYEPVDPDNVDYSSGGVYQGSEDSAQTAYYMQNYEYGEYVGGSFSWVLEPYAGYEVTSEVGERDLFGYHDFHYGIDLACSEGTPIRAANAGKVIFSEWHDSYGNYVVVDHGGGITTTYAHMKERAVYVGQWVEAGDLIGYVGMTGTASGFHLHFEVRVAGAVQNPRDWFDFAI